ITLDAQPVQLGTDDKGRPITSLALVLGETPAEPAGLDPDESVSAATRGRPQGANQLAFMQALKKAKGEPLGMTRLAALSGLENNRIVEAARALVAKGLIHEVGEAGARRWVLA